MLVNLASYDRLKSGAEIGCGAVSLVLENRLYRSKKEIRFAECLKQHDLKFETNPNDIFGSPDVFFREIGVAVFFHGCFWHSHGCKIHSLNENWIEKLSSISINDSKVNRELCASGIVTVNVWECHWDRQEDIQIARIKGILELNRNYGMRSRKSSSSSSTCMVA